MGSLREEKELVCRAEEGRLRRMFWACVEGGRMHLSLASLKRSKLGNAQPAYVIQYHRLESPGHKGPN